MGLGDLFKAKENQALAARVAELEAMVTPEQLNLEEIKGQIKNGEQKISDQNETINRLQGKINQLLSDIDKAKSLLIETNENVLMQSFGLYTPHFDFAKSDDYKDAISKIRAKQKELIKNGTAATGSDNWTIDGNKTRGRKMVADMKKLLLRAFNNECDDAVEHVKFNNISSAEKKILKSKDTISRLGQVMSISISREYYLLKIDELHLAYEYQVKKQEEKEEQKRIREQLREQAKLEKEIEEARKELEKEKKHYENALLKIEKQISGTSGDAELELLISKKEELTSKLEEIKEAQKQVDYREANQKAGYVYVISNIGAFGEGVYKIGMTRRLDPMDRIDELGDASVPFDFDVHAMIFSDDAPKLEAALHNAFADKKLNFVNQRREFFRVSLDEIKQVIKDNYDKTVEFTDIPAAEQYRQSLLIQKAKQ